MKPTGLKDKHGHDIFEGDLVSIEQADGTLTAGRMTNTASWWKRIVFLKKHEAIHPLTEDAIDIKSIDPKRLDNMGKL